MNCQTIKTAHLQQHHYYLIHYSSSPFQASALSPAPPQSTTMSYRSVSFGWLWRLSFQKMEPQETWTGNLFVTLSGDIHIRQKQLISNKGHYRCKNCLVLSMIRLDQPINVRHVWFMFKHMPTAPLMGHQPKLKERIKYFLLFIECACLISVWEFYFCCPLQPRFLGMFCPLLP